MDTTTANRNSDILARLLHDEQRDAHNANDLLNTGWRFAEMSDDSSPEISSDEEMLES